MDSYFPMKSEGKTAALLEALSKVQPSSLGHYLEAALPSDIKALTPFSHCLGTAITVYQPTSDSTPVHLALELISPGDVLLIDRGGDSRIACVGEMVATAAQQRGAKAIIVNGAVTDIEEISALGMPIYAKGTSVITTRPLYSPGARLCSEIVLDDIVIRTGDIIFGNINGLLSIDPCDKNIWNIIEKAIVDEEKEIKWKRQLEQGISLASLNKVDKEMFQQYVCRIPQI
ncbi:RraA family protein [Halomonas citrativorans]|uniref:RraA family protein n=1 Tax=Halomonas citrativorans TaxID=2742612 RepID=UPI000B3522B8|nr:RraA family protein [Halomonas citrativorans]